MSKFIDNSVLICPVCGQGDSHPSKPYVNEDSGNIFIPMGSECGCDWLIRINFHNGTATIEPVVLLSCEDKKGQLEKAKKEHDEAKNKLSQARHDLDEASIWLETITDKQ